MNRANQAALYQQTNLGLLSIRQAELNYYINLNIAFGTQAALIGGFTYGVFTQNQPNEDTVYADYFQDIYWVTSAGTIACGVHVIISTMCIQVYGPGLALHGPVGSMARAAEGMRIEQKPVIVSFILMMFLFSISTILSFWAVMSFYSAICGTLIFVIASRYWYYYCERIYLRFFWSEEDTRWRLDSRENLFNEDNEIPVPDSHTNPIHEKIIDKVYSQKASTVNGDGSNTDQDPQQQQQQQQDNSFSWAYNNSYGKDSDQNTDEGTGTNRRESGDVLNLKKNRRFFKSFKLFKRNSKTTTATTTTSEKNRNTSEKISPEKQLQQEGILRGDPASSTQRNQILIEGYLLQQQTNTDEAISNINTANGSRKSRSIKNSQTEKWERRYFILTAKSCLYLYMNRQAFRENPRQPIYLRPVDIHEYYIEVINSEEDRINNTSSPVRTNSVGSQGSNGVGIATTAPRFQITLIPKENRDTEGKGEITEDDRRSSAIRSSGSSYARKNWVLRCDTEEELETWIAVMQDLVPHNFL